PTKPSSLLSNLEHIGEFFKDNYVRRSVGVESKGLGAWEITRLPLEIGKLGVSMVLVMGNHKPDGPSILNSRRGHICPLAMVHVMVWSWTDRPSVPPSSCNVA
ncbi:hypothetical protein HAX54_048965, partial [Datura stramonium]|nr:hypothetical protein [Datura stramonium]